MLWLWLIGTWVISGLAFWLDTLRFNGLPTQWRTKGREDGWSTICVFWLPAAVLGGPLWWVLLLVDRYKNN